MNTSTPSPTSIRQAESDAQRGGPNGNTDPSKPMRSDEELLTGDTLAKVTAAVQAKEPDATIERVETDSEGAYEAHLVRADGTHITVEVDASFAVIAVQEGGLNGSGGPGGAGGRGHGPDDQEDTQDGSQDGGATQTPSSDSTAANG